MSLEKYASPIEREIVHALVTRALADGYTVSVNDGEETTLMHSTDTGAILGAMATTEEDYLTLCRNGKRVGVVRLIYGNGEDLISDYTDNITMQKLVESLPPE